MSQERARRREERERRAAATRARPRAPRDAARLAAASRAPRCAARLPRRTRWRRQQGLLARRRRAAERRASSLLYLAVAGRRLAADRRPVAARRRGCVLVAARRCPSSSPSPSTGGPAMTTATDRLELLPAVDVADGQAVRLVQGAAGTETSYGDPLDAALAWQQRRRRVGPPGRPRRRVRPRLQPRAARRGRRPARRQGRAVRRHPRRRVAGGRAGHRLRPGQHRHRRAGGPGLVRVGDRPVRRPDRRRPGRARHDPGRARLDPGRRRAVRGAGPARPRRLRPLRRHRRRPGRHADRPQPGPAARGVRGDRPAGGRPRRRLVAGRPAGHRRAGAGRRRGRDRRQGAVRRGVHPARRRWRRCRHDRTPQGLERCARGSRSSATRRAVAAGDHVWVTGCTSIVDGEVVHEGDPYAQTQQAIRNVALARWSSSTRRSTTSCAPGCYVTDISRWEEVRPGARRGVRRRSCPATSMVRGRPR